MPTKRVIAVLVTKNGHVVQSIGFKKYLPVGKPEIAARFLSEWGADEIVLLDIDASKNGHSIDPAMVERTAKRCFVPLSVGGGITNTDHIRTVLQHGADKVVLNTALFDNPDLLTEAAEIFGNQCLVASLDVKRSGDDWHVVNTSDMTDTGRTLREHAAQLVLKGAGEVMINSIDEDGRQIGYDLAMADHIGPYLPVPLILVGGAGHPDHIKEALSRPHVSAAAAANFLHYTEHTVTICKAEMNRAAINTRQDSFADYTHLETQESGRLNKRKDVDLDDEIFQYLPDEAL